MRRACLAVLTVSALFSPAAAAELTGPQIVDVLLGNSIVHPEFGCAHYRDARTSVQVQNGEERLTNWSVTGNLYRSSGQCGEIGCTLSGTFPAYIFRRTDGGYSQPVIVVKGNYCRKDGTIS